MNFRPMKSGKILWAILLSFLVGVALALTVFLPQPIECVVRDAESGVPLHRAFVWVDDLEGPQGSTDKDGIVRLRMSRLPHEVFVSAPKHVDSSVRFSFKYEMFHWRRGCFVDLPPTQARVMVIDSVTRAPLNEAEVWVDGKRIGRVGDGVFEQLRLSEGKHEVRVTASKHHPKEAEIFITRTARQDEQIEVSLEPFKYCVRALGIGGTPLEGVTVAAGGRSAVTDGNGVSCFYHLPEKFDVVLSHPAYLKLNRSVTFTAEITQEFSLEPRVLELRIWDPWKEEGVQGAKVSVGGLASVSDENGHVLLEPVPITGTVQVQASSYISKSMPVSGAPYTVPLEADGIKLTVVDSLTGAPVGGVVVTRQQCKWKGSRKGRVLLPKGVRGERITVDAEGYSPSTVLVSDSTPMTVTLLPMHLTGTVLDGVTGKPVHGARILVGGRVFEAPKGAFELSGVPLGGGFVVIAPGYKVLRVKGDIRKLVKPVKKGKCEKPPCVTVALERFEPKLIYINYGLLNDLNKLKYYVSMVEKSPVLNGFVVDAKGDRGYVAWRSKVPLVATFHSQGNEKVVENFAWLLQEARKKHLYVVARFVTFKDTPLATHKPDLAAKKSDGTIWLDRIGAGWANPYKTEVQAYNIALLKELASLGVDEIQLDYIRFPSDGNISDVVYGIASTKSTRTKAIREFVHKVQTALRPFPVFLSVDTFGLTVWVYPYEDMSIGQRVIDLGPHIDYLCPMLYPSTFTAGNLGYENPSAHPYEVIYRSVSRAKKLLPPTAKVRPWLQAYWYDLKSMQVQRKAAEDAQSCGWSFWNAMGNYPPALFSK